MTLARLLAGTCVSWTYNASTAENVAMPPGGSITMPR